jgi:hypothetical protein
MSFAVTATQAECFRFYSFQALFKVDARDYNRKMVKLGLKRTTLIHRMKKLRINRPLRVLRMDMPGSVTEETESMVMA